MESGACLAQALFGIGSWLGSACVGIGEKRPSRVVVDQLAVADSPDQLAAVSPRLIAKAYHIEAPARKTEPLIQHAKKLFQIYSFEEQLGTGAYGKVSVARANKSSIRYAVKCIPIHKFEEDCKDELNIAWQLAHPHIALVHEAFKDRSIVYIMMELCSGGTISQIVKGMPSKALPHSLVTTYARQMISAVAYMHHHRFAHRDIKPANFMLQGTSVDSSLKVIDMGFACQIPAGVPMTLRIGTVECSAPEVIRGSYGEKCDVWSLGVVLYYCCVGHCPFEDASATEVCRKVLDSEPVFDAQEWGYDSRLQTLVRAMLKKSQRERPFARQVAEANAGWLGIPEPDPSFVGVPTVSKEASKESLSSCKTATESRGTESRGPTSSKCTSSTGTKGGSPRSPKGVCVAFGVPRIVKCRRKSEEVLNSAPCKSQEQGVGVCEKRISRRASASAQRLLKQVQRTLSISSMVSQSKVG